MEKCPKCGKYTYQHNCTIAKYQCSNCKHIETDKEKQEDIKKFKQNSLYNY